MSDLPLGWASTTLEMATKVIRGITFPAAAKELASTSENVCCLRTANIQKDVTWGGVYYVNRQYVKRDEQLVQVGDILMSMANSYELVGKVAHVKAVTSPTAFGAFLSAVRPTLGIDGRYLFHFLRSDRVQLELREGSSQTTNIANISVGKLNTIEVPLAPMSEQNRIADQLDKLLARIQSCNDRLDAIPALLKRFRQSVLAAATSGGLIESGDLGGPWVDTIVGSIAVDLRYGTSKKCEYTSIGTGVLRIPNIADLGRIDVGDLKRAEFDCKEIDKLALREGDLLVIRSNGSVDLVGKTSLVTANEVGLLFAGYLMRLRVDQSQALPAFVLLCLSAPAQRSYIERTAKSTSGVNNLNAEELRALELRLPPLAEQAEIVRRVEALFKLADRIEACYKAARTHAQRITPLLLAKAFRGELVAQDPNDEPASVLLERIAAERAKTSAQPRPRRSIAGRKTETNKVIQS